MHGHSAGVEACCASSAAAAAAAADDDHGETVLGSAGKGSRAVPAEPGRSAAGAAASAAMADELVGQPQSGKPGTQDVQHLHARQVTSDFVPKTVRYG